MDGAMRGRAILCEACGKEEKKKPRRPMGRSGLSLSRGAGRKIGSRKELDRNVILYVEGVVRPRMRCPVPRRTHCRLNLAFQRSRTLREQVAGQLDASGAHVPRGNREWLSTGIDLLFGSRCL
jgi:hypothetical protein